MRKGRLKGRSGQPALTFFPTASVGPSVLSTCISKPGPSGRPIRKKSPVDSLIDPLLTLTSCPPVVTPPRPICSEPHRSRLDCALSLNGAKSAAAAPASPGRPGKTTERSSGCAQPLIQVLWARPEHGLDPVELACADALRPGACNASVSLTASTPAHTPLRCFRATPADPPTGDCRSDHQALLPAGQAPVA